MLSGLKFIPRDQLNTKNEVLDSDRKEKKKSGGRKEKRKIGKKKYDTSTSDDEEVEKISKGSRKNKKWYSSDEYSSPYESECNSDFVSDEKKHRRRRKEKKTCHEISEDEEHISNKRSKRSRKHCSSEEYSDSDSKSEDDDTFSGRKSKSHKGRVKHESHTTKRRRGEKDMEREDSSDSDRGSPSLDNKEIARKDAGLEWMLKPVMKIDKQSRQTESKIEEPQVEEVKKPNPKELNPYLKDNGSGYPQDAGEIKVGGDQLLPSSVVGDGGASWRMKALKRAKEQAAREGRKFEEVVEERWESLGHLTVSVASSAAAPSHAHLHAIRDRKRGITEKHEIAEDDLNKRDAEKVPGDTNQERVPGDTRKYLRDVSLRNPEMKAPKFHNDLYWRKKRTENMSSEGAELISAAASNLNKFANDGNFMCEFTRQHNKDADGSVGSSEAKNSGEDVPVVKEVLSANQLAAKALQLRMKGKHEEADKLLKEAEKIKVKQDNKDKFISQGTEGSVSRYIMKKDISAHKKKKEENADFHLAQHIMQNKQYSMSGQADDEYDYDGCPSKKRDKRRANVHKHKSSENANIAKRILTQQERCQFCFENPTRPKHLVISIANFTYLMLPQWQPIVQGHCCILPMLHESATRNVDNNVWEEIRNFKKCLIMMFAKQEKDVVFLETVIGLVQQRRHCLVECIPLPREIAKQAPLYFKKAIDEAEDEWSQHNAKKLIDTSDKGLRGSIPKDFPYFHVEFGLNKGFVHVIDDEKQFKSSFGLNVIRGMLRLPEEDMHRHRKHESLEVQRQAVASFARDWEPFDWTKQLD